MKNLCICDPLLQPETQNANALIPNIKQKTPIKEQIFVQEFLRKPLLLMEPIKIFKLAPVFLKCFLLDVLCRNRSELINFDEK